MRKYWEILKSQIKLDMAYSAWYWASTTSTILRMLVIYAFWHAVYASQATVNGMSLHSMITYIVFATLLNGYVAGVGVQLANSVRDGSVAIELMRPYNLLDKLVALDLGNKVTSTVRNTLPMLLIAFLFMGIDGPTSWTALPLFIISATLGILIGTQLDLILGILAFWLEYVWGLRVLRNAILLFFTGSLVPISMFPHGLQTVSKMLPFQSMVYVPVSIYTGQISGNAVLSAIIEQAFWLIGIFCGIRLCWSYAIRKVTIFGG
jgi:ABC-2 type transport system permease protein